MLDLKDLMLDIHLMNLVHQYLSVKDIIIFYTSSYSIIKLSNVPLYIGLLEYEYPFLRFVSESCKVYFGYTIFIYIYLKAQGYDDILAYLGTISNLNNKQNVLLYYWAITECFHKNWEVDYMILSNKFSKLYFHVNLYDKLFDLEKFDNNDVDESHYMLSIKKSLKVFAGTNIRWYYPDLLGFININKMHLIKPFTACKISTRSYIHKNNCKSHQICEMLNWQRE